MAIDWDSIYKQKWLELSGGYKKREDELNAAKARESAQLEAMLNQNRKYLENERDENLRQAYISKMNAYRELPETLKKSGLNGGITETAAADILRTYQNSRLNANNAFAEGVSGLNAEYGKNKSALENRYSALFSELDDKRNKDIWEQTKFAYNAALEEQRRAEAEAERLEKIRQFNELLALKQQAAAGSSKSGSSRSRSKKSGSSKSGSNSQNSNEYSLFMNKYKKSVKKSVINR